MKKITRATIKSFVAKHFKEGKLYINVERTFDGQIDGCRDVNDGFLKAEETTRSLYNTLGINSIWLVGHSDDGFEAYADDKYIGYNIYNCCGAFIIARPLQENDRRMTFCKEAQEKVEQLWTGKDWLCLHDGIPK